ncbi:MAG: hypothetical protein JNK20_05225 [Flavipsychrobacter sp.]|jgi:hypothetical protein|nr:hypothetical protein [Flavipsychrobacter sp.]
MNQANMDLGSGSRQGWLPRAFAHIVSIVFHPLFIPSYIAAFLLFLHPFAFAGDSDLYKKIKLTSVFVSTAFFPAFTVFLLKQLGFATSIRLKTQKERIIPIIASMVFYFWIFYVAKNQGDNPTELVQVLCAVFVSSIIALTANNFIKISLHGIAVGVLSGFFLFQAWISFIPMALPLMIAILITGMVGTARLILGEHDYKELIVGYLTGLVSMAIAALVI